MISPADPVEKIMDVIVRSILHHLDLLEDDHPLLLHILRIHERMEEDIGEEINGQRASSYRSPWHKNRCTPFL